MTDLPVWLLAVIFVVAAIAVWVAGTRLAHLADAISDKTGIGRAFLGMAMLGGITSLPEVGAVASASVVGNAPLAVNNLLGSLSINLALMVVIDTLVRERPLTSIISGPAVLLQGVLGILLMAVLLVLLATGDWGIGGSVGVGSVILALGVGAALWLSSSYDRRAKWRVDRYSGDEPVDGGSGPEKNLEALPLRTLLIQTGIVALVVIGAGYVLAISADAIANQAGIDSGVVGLILVGFATSLPELSTLISAAKLRRIELAIGDVFGTNIFNLAIFLVADAFYSDGPILRSGGLFEIVAVLIALSMTAIFLIGLLERRDRQIFGIGYDSLAAAVVFVIGLGVLFWISQSGAELRLIR